MSRSRAPVEIYKKMERFVGPSGNPEKSQSSEEIDNPNRPKSSQPEPCSVDSLTKIRDSPDLKEIPIDKKKMPETSLLKANERSKPQNRVSYPRLERLEMPVSPKWVRFAPDVEDSNAQNRFEDGGQHIKEREEVLEDSKDQNRFGDDQEIEKREMKSSGSDDDKEDDSENVVNPDPTSGFVMIKKNDQSESEAKEKSNESENWPSSLSTEIQTEFEIVGSHVMTKDIEGKVPVVFGVNFPAITQEKESQESSSSTTSESESSEETVESDDNNPLNEDDASWNDSGFDSWNSSETKTSSSMTTIGQDIGVNVDAEADMGLISFSPTSEGTSEANSNEIVAEPSVEMNKESDLPFTPEAPRSASRLAIVNSDYNLRATPERIRFAARHPDYPASQRRLSYNLDLADKMSKYA